MRVVTVDPRPRSREITCAAEKGSTYPTKMRELLQQLKLRVGLDAQRP